VSPRGKPIPAIDEQLFAATERLLVRGGPAGVASRAITDEAGVAKGVLHNHFEDLEGFLAAFVIDRSARLADTARKLISIAGSGSVLENLADATATLFGPTAQAIYGLVVARPEVARRIQQEHAGAASVLHEIQEAIAHYLEAEKRLGRITAATDTDTLAFTVFASAHQLFFGGSGQPIHPQRIHRVLASLLGVVTPPN
jgi:AcrR family transcriptional regulator